LLTVNLPYTVVVNLMLRSAPLVDWKARTNMHFYRTVCTVFIQVKHFSESPYFGSTFNPLACT